ncbi:H/ACA ribonucleoprotein complex, subunit Gar1 [Sesbania bispinosa]|nr:H/ACA ribonucleoprotein complex, subunit Gar1 [Sesbania bispinosa]
MEGILATSYSAGDKFYIDPRKLLPLARFLPQPKGQTQVGRGGHGGGGFCRMGGPRLCIELLAGPPWQPAFINLAHSLGIL